MNEEIASSLQSSIDQIDIEAIVKKRVAQKIRELQVQNKIEQRVNQTVDDEADFVYQNWVDRVNTMKGQIAAYIGSKYGSMWTEGEESNWSAFHENIHKVTVKIDAEK